MVIPSNVEGSVLGTAFLSRPFRALIERMFFSQGFTLRYIINALTGLNNF